MERWTGLCEGLMGVCEGACELCVKVNWCVVHCAGEISYGSVWSTVEEVLCRISIMVRTACTGIQRHTHTFWVSPRLGFCLSPYSTLSLSVSLSLPCFAASVTGPLSESQIAYMSRETLQVPHKTCLSLCIYLNRRGGINLDLYLENWYLRQLMNELVSQWIK